MGRSLAWGGVEQVEETLRTCFWAWSARWSASVTLCSSSCICKTEAFFFFLDTRTTSSRASLDQPPRTSTGPTPEECPHVSLLLLTPSLQPVRTRAPNTSQHSYVHVFNPGVTEVKHAYCLLTAIDG